MIEVRTDGPLVRCGRAIEARLKIGFPETKFTYRWIPAKVSPAAWQRLMQRPPIVGMAFNGFRRQEVMSDLDVQSDWSVTLVTNNSAGPEQRLFGDALAPGVLSLAEVASVLLHGHTVAGLGSFQVLSGAHAYVDEGDDAQAIVTIDVVARLHLQVEDVLAGPELDTDATIPVAWTFNPSEAP